MSEVNKREIVNEYLLKIFQEKFKKLAPTCKDRIVASDDGAICIYHDSSSTTCRFPICPKLDLPLDVAASYLEKTGGDNLETD